ncbi:oxidoreductase [Polyangium jinanense]|uniref:SDR family NAD(P)-dependent oxidoreductase n=1 Tax=Polyangium jinanense TaxID=2829994 RepID=A0A9X3XDJ0_9BACT|nr:oxidoreductase [Polyangium jinanense]MDC3960940.1 SDR family NAD(P)-dependent oxidoreductase [Polyangium jinanense]MDC3987360.1 SDR family NAD(P)-dependent oxidoreductase [Polyangium jinanense]
MSTTSSTPKGEFTSKGRVWFITGTSSGFGRSLAEEALRRGERVVATARNPETLTDLVQKAPDRVLALRLDVGRPEDIGPAIEAALARFGAIDVLVNNAGYGVVGAVEETSDAELRAQFEVNFFGAIALTRAALSGMRARRSGAIVQISSFGGQLSVAGFGAYSATKFALEGMSEALAAEVAPLGIRVLIVEPGAFRTRFGGSALRRMPTIDDYATTVGPTRAFAAGMDGTQEGDPAKAAAAIIDTLDRADAPLRLPLGADAVQALRTSLARKTEELETWAPVARSMAFTTT